MKMTSDTGVLTMSSKQSIVTSGLTYKVYYVQQAGHVVYMQENEIERKVMT